MKYKNMKTETVDKPSSIYATEKPSKTKGVMLQSTSKTKGVMLQSTSKTKGVMLLKPKV